MTAPITQDQVLDELAGLAAVEHALIVDYLLIHYAFSTVVASTPAVQTVVEAALTMAQFSDMRHLARVNELLVGAGRAPVLDRAATVTVASGADVAVGRLTPGRFALFPEAEQAVAVAVDRRYARLGEAVEAAGQALDPELAGEVTLMVATTGGHAGRAAALALPDEVDPGQLLAGVRTDPENDVERDLLAVSNRYYTAVVALVGAGLAYDKALESSMLSGSMTTMTTLHEINTLLVQKGKGLVPTFDLEGV